MKTKLANVNWKQVTAHLMLHVFGILAVTLMVVATSDMGNTNAANAMMITKSVDGADSSLESGLNNATAPIVKLIKSFIRPILSVVGAGAAVYAIFLGVKFATAEEPQEREKQKQHLKNAIIGFVLIFALVVLLSLAMNPLETWMLDNMKVPSTKK